MDRQRKKQLWQGAQVILHLVALIPLIWLGYDFWFDRLSVNPIQDLTFRTGKAGLILLVASLAVTPVRTITGWNQLIKWRRPLGLYAFLYIAVHFSIFIGLDYGFSWALIYEATFEKKYALVGFTAFVLMIPLAITSTQGWIRYLGKRWQKLHRIVYLIAFLAIVHYVWLVKSDYREPLLYGLVVVVLLMMRLPFITNWWRQRKKKR